MKRISYLIIAACALLYTSCAEEAVEDHVVAKNTSKQYETGDISISGLYMGAEADSYVMEITDRPESSYMLKAEFEITSEYSWKITNIPSWLTVTPTEGTPSLRGITVTCEAERNTTGQTRQSTMYVESGNKRYAINVSQEAIAGGNAVEPVSGVFLSGDIYKSGNKIGVNIGWSTALFYITSPYDWEIAETPDWISVESTSGKGSNEWSRVLMRAIGDNWDADRQGTAKLIVGSQTVELEILQKKWH